MKIAIFGGTFNPVHNGHINLLNACQQKFSFDKILVIPTNLPPHKKMNKLAQNQHRYNMLKLASADIQNVEISDVEFKLGKKSYTINTIIELKKLYPSADFFLIIGSDMLKTFKEWFHYKEILNAVTIIAAARNVDEANELLKYKDTFCELSSKINVIDICVMEISSTQIREMISKNNNIESLVNPAVARYIKENNLYK